MKPLQIYSLLKFKETSAKDIFLQHLKGLPINFGFIELEDKAEFIDFAVQHKLILFVHHKEYRGMLGLYKVLKEFSFYINRNDGMDTGKQYISVNIGDEIEISELYPIIENYRSKYKSNGSERHQIYRYIPREERAKLYEM